MTFEELKERIANIHNSIAEEHTEEQAEDLDPEDWGYDEGYLNALDYILRLLEEVKL